jgi:hypothetical protein
MKPSALAFVFVLSLLVLCSTSAALAQIIPPGGRLTLVSNTPVMTSDVVGATTVYYTPYVSNSLPVETSTPPCSGGNCTYGNDTFSQLTLTLNSTYQTAGNIYDIFTVLGDGFYICTGPAWASSTSRGTGAGTTQLVQVSDYGLWTNANTISSCYNGGGSVADFAAGVGVYIGSIYMTANGETSMQFKPASASGGSASVLGVYNAYNRVMVSSRSVDSTNSWTYAGAAWRASDDSTSNRITFVDGLQQSFIEANFLQASNQTSGIQATIGSQIDATTGAPPGFIGSLVGQSGYLTMIAKDDFDPQLGLHYIQAMEYSSGSTATFYGAGNMLLQIALEM